MGKYYKSSTVPIVDYGFKLPFSELFTAVKYKQDRSDQLQTQIDNTLKTTQNWYSPIPTDQIYIDKIRGEINDISNKYSSQDLYHKGNEINREINALSNDPELLRILHSSVQAQQYQTDYLALSTKGLADPTQDPLTLFEDYNTLESGIFSTIPKVRYNPYAMGQDLFGEMSDIDRTNEDNFQRIINSNVASFIGTPPGRSAMTEYLQNNQNADYGPLDQFGLPTDPNQLKRLGIDVLNNIKDIWKMGDPVATELNLDDLNKAEKLKLNLQRSSNSPFGDLIQTATTGNGSAVGVNFGGTNSSLPILMGSNPFEVGGEGTGTFGYRVNIGKNTNNANIYIDPSILTNAEIRDLRTGQILPNPSAQQTSDWYKQFGAIKQFMQEPAFQQWYSIHSGDLGLGLFNLNDPKKYEFAYNFNNITGIDDLSDAAIHTIDEEFSKLLQVYSSEHNMFIDVKSDEFKTLVNSYVDYYNGIADGNKTDLESSISTMLNHMPTMNGVTYIPGSNKVSTIDGRLTSYGEYVFSENQMSSYFMGIYKNDETGQVNYYGEGDAPPGWSQVWGKSGFQVGQRKPDWDENLGNSFRVFDIDGVTHYGINGFYNIHLDPQVALSYDRFVLGGEETKNVSNEQLKDNSSSRLSILATDQFNQSNKEFYDRTYSNNYSLFDPRNSKIYHNNEYKLNDASLTNGVKGLLNTLNAGGSEIDYIPQSMRDEITAYLTNFQTNIPNLITNLMDSDGTFKNEAELENHLTSLAELKTFLGKFSYLKNVDNSLLEDGSHMERAIEYQNMIGLSKWRYDNIVKQNPNYKNLSFTTDASGYGVNISDESSYRSIGANHAEAIGLVKLTTFGDDNNGLVLTNQAFIPYASVGMNNKLKDLDILLKQNNAKFNITGAYRTPSYNDKLQNSNKSTSNKPSVHLSGNGIDLTPASENDLRLITDANFIQSVYNLGLFIDIERGTGGEINHIHIWDATTPNSHLYTPKGVY